MSGRDWNELLQARQEKGFKVCVGLDSDDTRIPGSDRSPDVRGVIMTFNGPIVAATHDLVTAFKPNIAFYEAHGPAGLFALHDTIEYINQVAPEVPVVLDEKRADIGNTNRGYVRAAFEYFGADAVTVNPYLGAEGLQPFLDQKEKGIIVLCRTTNKGAREFQDRIVSITPEEAERWGLPQGTTMPLYQLIAWRVSREWNSNNNCALVVGATYPEELAEVRQIVGEDMPLLIPGIGTQGGDLEKTVRAGVNSKGQGTIINSSSAIIFASNGLDFAEAARRETLKLHKAIQEVLATAN